MNKLKNLVAQAHVTANEKIALATVGAAGTSLAVAGRASAAQDYSGVGTSVTSEITAALPVILGIAGLLIGISAALHFVRRNAR